MTKNKEVRKVTLGLIVSWIFGVIWLLNVPFYLFTGSFVWALTFLIMALAILPPMNKVYKEKLNFEISRGTKFLIIIVGIIVLMWSTNVGKVSHQGAISQPTTNSISEENIISKSFNDFAIKCDDSATDLQKEEVFEKFKDKYVEWAGEVVSVSESFGKYSLQVRHCDSTLTSDITIQMKEDQKNKLLELKEGYLVTYRAKPTRLGSFLGISASEGEIIDYEVREKKDIVEKLIEETPSGVIGNEETSKLTENRQVLASSKRAGITLEINSLTFEEKGGWGKIKTLGITVINEMNDDLWPQFEVFVYDKENPNIDDFSKPKWEQSEGWLENGQFLSKEYPIDVSVAGSNRTKIIKVDLVADTYPRRLFNSVEFETNLQEWT
jgi:hypothetical protein